MNIEMRMFALSLALLLLDLPAAGQSISRSKISEASASYTLYDVRCPFGTAWESARTPYRVGDTYERYSIGIGYGRLTSDILAVFRPDESQMHLFGLNASYCMFSCRSTINSHIGLDIWFNVRGREYTRTVPLVGGGTTEEFKSKATFLPMLGLRQNISRVGFFAGIGLSFEFDSYSYDPKVENPIIAGDEGVFVAWSAGGLIEIVDHIDLAIRYIKVGTNNLTESDTGIFESFDPNEYYGGWKGLAFSVAYSGR